MLEQQYVNKKKAQARRICLPKNFLILMLCETLELYNFTIKLNEKKKRFSISQSYPFFISLTFILDYAMPNQILTINKTNKVFVLFHLFSGCLMRYV